MSETVNPVSDLVVETPASIPVVETPAAAQVEAAPSPELHTETASLLETLDVPGAIADKAPEIPENTDKPAEIDVKAEETPKPDDKPAEVTEVTEKPVEPVVYEMKLPEGIVAPPEKIEAYTGVLREAGIPPEVGQRLLDLHAETVRAMSESALADQHRAFADVRASWRDAVKADPQLGGSGYETSLKAVARGREFLLQGYTPEQREAFTNMLRVTGVGDHPEFLRMLYAASRYTDEPRAPAPVRVPSPNNGARPRAGFASMYDHPTSQRLNGG